MHYAFARLHTIHLSREHQLEPTEERRKTCEIINFDQLFYPFYENAVCALCVCRQSTTTATATGRRKKMSVHLFLLSFVSLTFVNIHIDVDHCHTCIFGLLRSWRTKKKIPEPKPKLKVEPWHSHKNMWEQEHKTENKTRWKRGIRNVLSRLIYVTMIIWNINKRRIEQRC